MSSPPAGVAPSAATPSVGDRDALPSAWCGMTLPDGRPLGPVVAIDQLRGTTTFAVLGDAAAAPAVETVWARVPSTPAAAVAVEREARLLVDLRRRRLGPIERSIPRHAGTRRVEGRLVALASTLPGRPMCAERGPWPIEAQRWRVRRDFQCASEWLSTLQDASATGRSRVDWPDQVVDLIRNRWSGHPLLSPALSRLEPAATRLAEFVVGRTVVHGDFWHGNVLVDGQRVTGVLNWYDGESAGSPLRDLARFALRYGHDESGHVPRRLAIVDRAGLRATGAGSGLRLDLLGRGWFPRMLRAFLQQGLERLGLSAEEWYAVAVVGVGELAACDLDPAAAEAHLLLLAGLPLQP